MNARNGARPGRRYAHVIGWGSYAPSQVLTNADLERMVDTSDEWILERTGIRERHISADDEASSDLAVHAARRALDMANVKPEEIDQIIVATTTPDRILPSCACTLQAKIGAAYLFHWLRGFFKSADENKRLLACSGHSDFACRAVTL